MTETANFSLAGKVAAITGGSKGIGRSIARRLGQAGAKVVIGARGEADLEAALATLTQDGIDARAVVVDLRSADGPRRLVEECISFGGRLDIVVNNAGSAPSSEFLNLTDEDFLASWELKLLGAIRMIRLAIPHMQAVGGGQIINIAGTGGREPGANQLVVGTTNAALRVVSKGISKGFGAGGIRSNVISPGRVDTDRYATYKARKAAETGLSEDEIAASDLAQTPTRRITSPDEIAELALLMAAGLVPNLTGSDVVIDGSASNSM
ncbi:SDR family NAD(P)-dependent oxidoreductase [Acrocarpospora catenulata]|uniref:SDR family NAD(P)-dependent oxidoreductase n=1 Tax=Acrocarpospora catenulata TaxID=2836182 RepID=UPI001BDA49CC|nr:SDR family oxidoreductase [Acrocarpospora catenulata]